MAYGHSPIYDWQNNSVEQLKRILVLTGELENLGVKCISDDARYSIQQEIKMR